MRFNSKVKKVAVSEYVEMADVGVQVETVEADQ